MCECVCEFVWDCGSYYSTRRAAVVTRGEIASKIISEKFFWLTGLVRMGYEYFYQNIAEWLLLSMLIFIDSLLQILILDNFCLIFFIIAAPIIPYARCFRSESLSLPHKRLDPSPLFIVCSVWPSWLHTLSYGRLVEYLYRQEKDTRSVCVA